MRRTLLSPAFLAAIIPGLHAASQAAIVGGELKQWHRVSVDIAGPAASETGTPNPFLDFRLQVDFIGPSARTYQVPGFYAADGRAGETGSDTGRIWRAYFAPDMPGRWTYRVSFRAGGKVALADDTGAGVPIAGDGDTGEFTVGPTDKSGRDFRGRGRLDYMGVHHLLFAGTGEYFLKAGSDSPENMLGYADFDGTSKLGGGSLKTWSPHVRDWREGDPTWRGGKGKGLIGALNYLAGKGLNAFSFLTFNPVGDGKDVWMHLGPTLFDRFDCSKLDQWEIVFGHGQALGLFLHFKTQETETDQTLDKGDLGENRKLYYRELVARFGHHLALNWNLGEENTQTLQQVRDCAAYFYALDPYKHPIVLHTYPGEHDKYYGPLKGNTSLLTGISVQTGWNNVYAATRKWREESAAAGRKWVVANDEQGGANVGVAADAGYPGNRGSVPDNRDGIRQQTLWGNIMAGGAGVEYYFGYATGETDLTLQDFRSRETKWDDARHALEFFGLNGIPYWEMSPSNLSSEGWTLAKPGEHYVVYLPEGGRAVLDLASAPGRFAAKWFNPRTGEFSGESVMTGGSKAELGQPPGSGDWAIWLRKEGLPSSLPGRRAAARPAAGGPGAEVRRVDGRILAPGRRSTHAAYVRTPASGGDRGR